MTANQKLPALLFSVALLLAGGCVNLEPTTDSLRSFALGPDSPLPRNDPGGSGIYLERPDIPPYAAGNRMAVRSEDGELRKLIRVLWAERMSEGLARAAAEWIALESGRPVAGFYPWPEPAANAVPVKLRFLQIIALDSGEVIVAADWKVGGANEASGRYRSSGLVWTPGQPETIVAAYNQALREIAVEIAAVL